MDDSRIWFSGGVVRDGCVEMLDERRICGDRPVSLG